MANPYNPSLLPRTYFRAPRVPFDFRAVLFAMLGYLAWWLGDLALSKMCGVGSVSGAYLQWLAGLFKSIPYVSDGIHRVFEGVFHYGSAAGPRSDYTFWHELLGGAWFVAIWTFVTLGVARITALRIARDEGMSLAETAKFALKNWTTLLYVPLIVAGIIALFTACNALAGVLISIPWLGGILGIALLPLAALSTLLILLVALGGIAGFPLIGAAAAWEVNGSLDAVSRAFSYVFARPLQFFWNYFLIFLFTGVVLLLGHWFTYTLTSTVDFGVWRDNLEIVTAAPASNGARGNELSDQWKDYDQEVKDRVNELRKATGYEPGRPAPHVTPFARDLSSVAHVSHSDWIATIVWWIVLNVAWLGFFGYAVFFLIGASASVYADLREDVDGTEEDEIWVDEDDLDLDALAEGGPAEEAPPAKTPSGDAPASDQPAGHDAAGGSDAPAASEGDKPSE